MFSTYDSIATCEEYLTTVTLGHLLTSTCTSKHGSVDLDEHWKWESSFNFGAFLSLILGTSTLTEPICLIPGCKNEDDDRAR